MIISNGKTISAIYKGDKSIEKIYKGTLVIYESFKRLLASGTPTVTIHNCKAAKLVDYKIFGNGNLETRLPDEYQEIQYIQTTGTQYIDSKVPLKSGLKIIVDWIYLDADSGNNYTGGHIGSPGNRWLIGSQRLKYYYFAVGATNTPTEFYFGERDIVEACWKDRASYIKVNGVKAVKNKYETYTFTEEPTYSFYMGAVNRGGSATLKPKLTIYSWKFYQDDELIRDYIPCYRRSDNKPGLYDLVNNEFYVNDGTDEFVMGPSTPSMDNPINAEWFGEYDVSTDEHVISVEVNDNTTEIRVDDCLRKLGDYSDYITYEKQQVVRKIGVSVFDGSEDWIIHTSIDGGNVFRLDGVLDPSLDATILDTYMSHFSLTTIYSTGTWPVGVYRFSYNQNTLAIASGRLYVSTPHTTLEEFKQWLEDNLPVIYYPLKTIDEYSVELPDISVDQGTNVINVNSNITPSNVEITYLGKNK